MRGRRGRRSPARLWMVGVGVAVATVVALDLVGVTGIGDPPAAAMRALGRLAPPGPVPASPATRHAPATPVSPAIAGTKRSTGELAAAADLVGLRDRSIVVDGVRRTYLISIPVGLHGPAPLVLAFHGLYGNAGAFARQSALVPATVAAREVLVLPQSRGPGFNDGRFGPGGPRDDAFAMAIIGRLEHRGIVDPERVTVAGFSNGAGMAMAVAAAHPDRIAAVVAIDGELISGALAPRPTGPVEVVLVHGTADPIQPWAGRARWGPDAPAYISETQTVDAWVRADACRAPTTATLPGRIGPGAAGPVTVEAWAPGPSGAGVTSYRVAGLHHRWPVGMSPVGRSDQLAAIDATRIVVRTAAAATREGRRTVIV